MMDTDFRDGVNVPKNTETRMSEADSPVSGVIKVSQNVVYMTKSKAH